MATIKCSTPERRSIDDRPLSLIPNEVYFEIFDQLQSTEELTTSEYKHALSNLALVCRLFCAIALPRLFQTMTFCAKSLGPNSIAFCRQLIKNQAMARSLSLHVKTCIFSEWLEPHDAWTRCFFQLCTQSLSQLVNIVELTISETTISGAFWKAICSLKYLRSLTVRGCDFQSHASADSPASPIIMNLTRLEVHGCMAHLRVASSIDPTQLRVVRTDSATFALALLCFKPVPLVLEDLGVMLKHKPDNEVNIAALRVILDRSPLLTSLSITVPFPNDSEHSLTLQPPLLPMLRKLECPWYMIDDLIPGRSLKEISVPCIEFPNRFEEFSSRQGLLSAFNCSMADIESLRIPLQVYLEVSFADFGRLCSLCLECSPLIVDPSEVIDTLCDRWTRSPPVSDLTLLFHPVATPPWYLDLGWQHRLVAKLSKAFPTAVRLQITRAVEWRRKSKQSSQWIPFVPYLFRHDLKEDIKTAPRGRVRDFNGCFAGLFSPTERAVLGHLELFYGDGE